MSKKLSVKNIAADIERKKSSKFLTKIFKKIVLSKFKNITNGYIEFINDDISLNLGNKNSKLKAKVEVLSDEFYVFIGSAGLLGASESYALGHWKSNNLTSLFQIMLKNHKMMNSFDSGFASLLKPINKFIHYTRNNTILGSKKNILAHYDLSNEFYKLWLDTTMTYSSGIFLSEESSLYDASIEKLDRICRKLDLNEKDHILEIGTGWGSFAIHAAKKYNCKITTTTISDSQYEYAKNKIEEEGLSKNINLINKDYRLLDGKYDKIVSIEMIEAVGHKYVPEYFRKINSLLNDNGMFAMQGITYNDQKFDTYKNSVDFINKYIFPGSCLISVHQVSEIIKKHTNLIFNDLDDITSHYAKTLNIWRNNFFKEVDNIRKLGFSDSFINLWEFYFVYCEAGFKEKNIGDYQFIFTKKEGLL